MATSKAKAWDQAWVQDITYADVQKAHAQIVRARSMKPSWGAGSAASPTTLLADFLRELVQNHIEIERMSVALAAQRLENVRARRRHTLSLSNAEATLKAHLSHRAYVQSKFEELLLVARKHNDIEQYRMLSDALKEIYLMGDAEFDALFHRAYAQVSVKRGEAGAKRIARHALSSKS